MATAIVERMAENLAGLLKAARDKNVRADYIELRTQVLRGAGFRPGTSDWDHMRQALQKEMTRRSVSARQTRATARKAS